MTQTKNIIYSLNEEKLMEIGNYLGKNSEEYGFSTKKGEKRWVYFMDNKKRIFAILNQYKKEVKLARDVNPEIINGIEKIIDFGEKN